MKNLKLFLGIFFIILAQNFLNSIAMASISVDTNAYKYFPLNAGNKFVYDYYFVHVSPTNPSSYSGTKSIYVSFDTMVYNGNVFFYISGLPFLNYNPSAYYRIDSTTESLMNYNPNNSCPFYYYEVIADSLSALPGDSVRDCVLGNVINLCTNLSDTNIFGISTNLKKFNRRTGGPGYNKEYLRSYAKNFGLIFFKATDGYSLYSDTTYYRLKGCVLNGVVYGDTTQIPITGINQISNIIPKNYLLSQNFPNPFNPVTKIQFDISNKSNVKLTVYDALGKEITTLVNESLSPGSYDYHWDASSFPSGVYFYRLEANDFIETKRMVLMK